ncbi:MAG: hypothetical protein WDZ40_01615 [Candidatus Spechtbacterales bacterium]
MDVQSKIEDVRNHYIEEAEKFADAPLWKILLWRLGIVRPSWDEEFLSEIEVHISTLPDLGRHVRLGVARFKRQCESEGKNLPIEELKALNRAIRKHVTGFSF